MSRIKKNNFVVGLLLFSSVSFCSLSLADTPSQSPVYCRQGECLYCNEAGCMITPQGSSKPQAVANGDAVSSADMDQLVSDLMQKENQLAPVHKPSATSNSMSMDTSISEIEERQPMTPPYKKPPRITHKPVVQPKRVRSKPKAQSRIFFYQPTVDIAQYALHQGNSRSANLVEGFIPLGRWMFDKVLFLDARFYNPNGTPIEGNIDLGFRRLFHQNSRLFGLYAGYDRYRSSTGNDYNQVHGGFEYWITKLFLGGNVYIPIGRTVYNDDALNQAFLIPTAIFYRYNIGFQAGEERVLPGGDLEIGYDITRNLTAYVGGYYFDHREVPHILGSKARATYTFYHQPGRRLLGLFDRIRLEGLVSHDSIRGTSWYAGLRASIALFKETNPTHGLIRHMVDPLRRDMNVITSGYNTAARLYQIDGRPARVDLVDASLTRSIDEAVDGSPGTAADIIGVRGSYTPDDVLTAGGRYLTITGNAYSFTFDGRPYTIEKVGDNGELTADTGTNLWALDGSEKLSLEDLTMYVDEGSSQFLLRNGAAGETTGGGTFNLTIDNCYGNAPIDLTLDSSNTTATGSLSFTNNELQIDGSTASNGNATLGAVTTAGLAVITEGSAQAITITSFHNNQIYISDSPLVYTMAILNDGIGTTSILGDVVGNTLQDADNVLSLAHGWYINTETTIYGSVSGNTFNESNDSDGYGWRIEQPTIITGNVNNNKFTSSHEVDDNSDDSYGWYINAKTDITGDVSGNQFTNSFNDQSAYGWYIVGETTIHGSVSYNTFDISHISSGDASGWHIEGQKTTVDGDVIGNTFKKTRSSGSGDEGSCWYISANEVNIGGSISNNKFISRHNDKGAEGIYIVSDADVTIGGNISDNIFTIANNEANGYGWTIQGDATIKGLVTNNTFNIFDNTGTGFPDNIGIFINYGASDGSVTFEQAIRDNEFYINGSLTADYGFYLNTGSTGPINFFGNKNQGELQSSNASAAMLVVGLNPASVHYAP